MPFEHPISYMGGNELGLDREDQLPEKILSQISAAIKAERLKRQSQISKKVGINLSCKDILRDLSKVQE